MSYLSNVSPIQRAILQALLASPMPTVMMDESGHYLAINQSLTNFLRWQPDDLIGQHHEAVSLWHPSVADDCAHAFAQLEKTGVYHNPTLTYLRDKTGDIVYASVAMHRQLIESQPFVVMTIVDCSHIAREQSTLARKIQFYEQVIHNLPDFAFIIYDEDLRYRVIENRNQVVPYLKAEDLVGKTIYEVMSESVLKGNEPYYKQALLGESAFMTRKIHDRIFTAQFVPLHTWEQKYGLIILRDAEQSSHNDENTLATTLEMERGKLLADFITHAMHEFRTPLSVIQANTYLLQQNKLSDEQRTTKLEQIHMQSENITNLVDKLIIMVRLDNAHAPILKPMSINSVTDVLALRCEAYVRDKGLHFTYQALSEPVMMMGNAQLLSLALWEVMENALQHTSRGHQIDFRVSRTAEGQLRIEIADDGVGIPLEAQKHIFEHFYRSDDARTTRGMGLGLAITRRVIDQHYGSITVTSMAAPANNHGTHIIIYLPLTSINEAE